MSSGPEPTKLEPPGAENAKTLEQSRTQSSSVSLVYARSDKS